MKSYAHPSLDDVPLALIMQALSDPCRLAIVRALLGARKGELACNEVPLRVAKATRSHHFSVLREAGLAFTRMKGTKCMTSIRQEEIKARFPGLLDLVLITDPPKKRRARSTAKSQTLPAHAPRR